MALSLEAAMFVALVVESVFYGYFLALFCRTIEVMLAQKSSYKRRDIRWPFALAALVLFICGTLDVVFHFKLNIDGFILHAIPGGPAVVFGRISGWINPALAVLSGTQALVGDAILIYRCHIVYNKSYLVIIMPCLLWAGTASATIGLAVTEALYRGEAELTTASIGRWTDALACLVFLSNSVATALLVVRLRVLSKDIASISSGRIISHSTHRAIRIIMESGLIYSLLALSIMILSFCRSFAVYIVADMSVQMVGVLFNLMIIRVCTYSTVEAEAESQWKSSSRSIALRYNSEPPRSFDSFIPLGESGLAFCSRAVGSGKDVGSDVELATSDAEHTLNGDLTSTSSVVGFAISR